MFLLYLADSLAVGGPNQQCLYHQQVAIFSRATLRELTFGIQ